MEDSSLKYVPDEELLMILNRRATGRTTRIVDELIQDFFSSPVGTKIHFADHYPYEVGNRFLLDVFAKRLEMEHHCKPIHGKDQFGHYVMREEKTFHELVVEEINRRKKKA